jgi:hypothetical protein
MPASGRPTTHSVPISTAQTSTRGPLRGPVAPVPAPRLAQRRRRCHTRAPHGVLNLLERPGREGTHPLRRSTETPSKYRKSELFLWFKHGVRSSAPIVTQP